MSRIPVPLATLQPNIPTIKKRKSTETSNSPEAKRRSGEHGQTVNASAEGLRISQDDFDVFARTGLSAREILEQKLSFKKSTAPAKKVEELLPAVKNLRAVGLYLLQAKEDLEQQTAKLEQELGDAAARAQAKEADWTARIQDNEEVLQEINVVVANLENDKSTLQAQVQAACDDVAARDSQIQQLEQAATGLRADLDVAAKHIADKEAKIAELEGLVQQAQAYSGTLQQYNTTLQSDMRGLKERNEELAEARASLQQQLASVSGTIASLEKLHQVEKDQVAKLREEREAAAKDLAIIRNDMEALRQERDRLAADNCRLQEEADKQKAMGSKSLNKVESLAQDKQDLEAKCSAQAELLQQLRNELAQVRAQSSITADTATQYAETSENLKMEVNTLRQQLQEREQRLHESDAIRRKLHNTIQELKGNIRVFCRVRPQPAEEILSAVELGANGCSGDKALAVTVPSSSSTQPSQKHPFSFDKVFGPSASQQVVFQEVSELVQSALDGRKVCIFAYGQTGSGKTFTMLGDSVNQGIIPRAMQQVFDSSQRMASQGWQFTMTASMLEIYNEEYRDLLQRKRSAEPKKHQVVHDSAGNTTVSDLTLVDVSQADSVGQLLKEAMEKRSVGCTSLNEQSSRSHMVFSLRIEGLNNHSGDRMQGMLNLIDLAGSERVKESGAVGARLKEAQSINKSLSALGDVIVALSQKNEHIPYRNSKLTWLLQPCLGGDAKTLMIVNVNPAVDFAQETLCSLRFAHKVNSVVLNGAARKQLK